jgi:hypothetical protein
MFDSSLAIRRRECEMVMPSAPRLNGAGEGYCMRIIPADTTNPVRVEPGKRKNIFRYFFIVMPFFKYKNNIFRETDLKLF